jgi:nucleoside-diphosphate-sugar epimerase
MSRIFLAGAAGVIGRRLTPLLVAHSHSVWGATRSPDNCEFLGKLGARPVLVDVFDAEALAAAVLEAKPEIVIHQLTDLAVVHDPAARNAGARRLIAQSIAWAYAPGPRPHNEEHPLDTDAEGDRAISVRGVASLERQVLAASPVEGLVLRYGRFYGPGTGTNTPPGPRTLHVDAAAYAALLAIDRGEPGAFNIADPNDEVSRDKATAALGWRADFRMDAA